MLEPKMERGSPNPAPAVIRLSGGLAVPYPRASTSAATAVGRANRRTGTGPEVRLRSALHAAGLRFRKDFLVRVPGLRVHVDVAFTRPRLAIFVDGCFWHGCPEHGRSPKSNVEYWVPKLASNRGRDERVNLALQADGWTVLRLWEHTATEDAVTAVEAALEQARCR